MITYTEAKRLIREWGAGSFRTRKFNIRKHYNRKHYNKHGQRVRAENIWQYLRKASAFRQEARGIASRVAGATAGVYRYRKQGRYIDLAPEGKIVSFGRIA